MTLKTVIASLGGLAATHQLHAAGWNKHALTAAVAAGTILRVRQGWYCLPSAPEPDQQAVRVGGRLSCTSGAERHGLLVRSSSKLHVAVTPNAARLRSRSDKTVRLATLRSPDVTVHWSDADASGSAFCLDVRDCLAEMALCQSPEWVVAAVDSALRLHKITMREWLEIVAELPGGLGTLLAEADILSESITESVTRFRLHRIGIIPRLQVKIRGVGRVDMLIGTRLVIEVDGYAYHADPERFEADRRRDARLSALGYRVLRFSYKQVMHHWSEVRAAIIAAMDRGDHN
jgi:very-short-patch-repair endonuclease